MAITDGTILTGTAVTEYLPVEHAGDDDLISRLIEEAEAVLEDYLGRAISSAEHTEYFDGGVHKFFVTNWPIQSGSVTITDTQGTTDVATDDETVDSSLYRIYEERGVIARTSTTAHPRVWGIGLERFKVVYTGGLTEGANWSGRDKLLLRRSLTDLLSHWYDLRLPGVSRESVGGGVTVSVDRNSLDVPERVSGVWDRFREPY